jgi:hypothetical protein
VRLVLGVLYRAPRHGLQAKFDAFSIGNEPEFADFSGISDVHRNERDPAAYAGRPWMMARFIVAVIFIQKPLLRGWRYQLRRKEG